MGSTTPLLSIIIPTRNRADYLESAVRSALSIPSSDIELVVEDNSDSSQFENRVRDCLVDSRLVYHFSNHAVSMTENYEHAMQHATGDYVCLIGDDDGLNPEIVEAVRWAKDNDLDAVVPLNPAHYVWPDLNLPSGAIRAGELRISPFSGTISFPNASEEVLKCAASAGQSFAGLPKVYYGIVRRNCLQRVKDKTGSYFPGVSPDMAGAVAVANYVGKMCQIDYPLFLPGSSARSNAGISGMGRHIGRLMDQQHLAASSIQNWSKIVPAFYSVQTIWAEAAVSALLATGRTDILKEFNVPMLYAELAMWHPKFLPMTARSFYPALQIVQQGVLRGTIQFARYFSYIGLLRAKSLLMRFRRTVKLNDAHRIAGLPDISEAVCALSEYLAMSGKHFADLVN